MQTRARQQDGFTLIELLIVMMILAILMGITIPIFLGQKDKAFATQAKQMARLTQGALEACASNRTDGYYTSCAIDTEILKIEPSLFNAFNTSTLTVTAGGLESYTIVAQSKKGAASIGAFTIMKTGTGVLKDCSNVPGHNVCDMSLPPGFMW